VIDLSITQDAKWIKAREKLWKPIAKSMREDLRQDEIDKIHNYFMTGTVRVGEELSDVDLKFLTDGAAFCWHPIQTPESWDYLFQHVVKDEQQYAY